MKIELEPTGSIQEVNGQRCRIWEGKTDKGVPVKAWVMTVSEMIRWCQELKEYSE